MAVIYFMWNNYIWFWCGFHESQWWRNPQASITHFSLCHGHAHSCTFTQLSALYFLFHLSKSVPSGWPLSFSSHSENLPGVWGLSSLLSFKCQQNKVWYMAPHILTTCHMLLVSLSCMYVSFLTIDFNILNNGYLVKCSSAFPYVVTHITYSN